jgi:hypothetical protein
MFRGASEPSSRRGRAVRRNVHPPPRIKIDMRRKGLAIIEYRRKEKKMIL